MGMHLCIRGQGKANVNGKFNLPQYNDVPWFCASIDMLKRTINLAEFHILTRIV